LETGDDHCHRGCGRTQITASRDLFVFPHPGFPEAGPVVFNISFHTANTQQPNQRMKTKMTGSIVRCLLIAAATGASAQVTLTGTNYTETFDGIRSGLPRGWTVRTNASATSLGTPASFNPTNTSWGTQTGQFANYASTTGNGATNFSGGESTTVQGSCTNRCPGIRQTTTFGDPGAAFVLQLQNTIEFANFQLSLDCNLLSEQTNRSTVWTIDYGVGSTPVNFVWITWTRMSGYAWRRWIPARAATAATPSESTTSD
jgi:hypothetical protein